LSFEFFKRIADSRQLSCDDPDHLSSVASDDGRAGYSLYRWALEVNNINLNVFLDGDDRNKNVSCKKNTCVLAGKSLILDIRDRRRSNPSAGGYCSL
jgi:hypothetical protein